MSRELELLAHWSIDSYARNRDDEDAMIGPLLVICGGDLDALATTGEVAMGFNDIERLAFLIGYLGYPCDAIYLTATWEALSVETEAALDADGRPTVLAGPPPLEEDQTMRESLMCWAHIIPTGETLLLMRTRHVQDDGTSKWMPVNANHGRDMFVLQPLVQAAHAFDPYPIGDTALVQREQAKAILQEANGVTHDTLFYDPGVLLHAAESHQRKDE